jgi:integrating conjugative element membrane protein (TIGR03747 family)
MAVSRSRGARKRNSASESQPKRGGFNWLIGIVFGRLFEFISWSFVAVIIAIGIEWVGMIFWWDGNHSTVILQTEMAYLNGFNRNLILNIYPGDLADLMINEFNTFISWAGISAIAHEFSTSGSSVINTIGLGAQSAINVIFLFCVRLAICISAISGFILIGALAFMDGLTEREIRKNSGGHESALLYHHAKRWLSPSIFMSLGFYLTMPISIHPTLIFLPAMTITGMIVFITASKFKKYL